MRLLIFVVFITLFLFWFDSDESRQFEMYYKIWNLLCLIYLADVQKKVTRIILKSKINSFASLLDFCQNQSNKEYEKKKKSLRIMISKVPLTGDIFPFPSKFQVMELSDGV